MAYSILFLIFWSISIGLVGFKAFDSSVNNPENE